MTNRVFLRISLIFISFIFFISVFNLSAFPRVFAAEEPQYSNVSTDVVFNGSGDDYTVNKSIVVSSGSDYRLCSFRFGFGDRLSPPSVDATLIVSIVSSVSFPSSCYFLVRSSSNPDQLPIPSYNFVPKDGVFNFSCTIPANWGGAASYVGYFYAPNGEIPYGTRISFTFTVFYDGADVPPSGDGSVPDIPNISDDISFRNFSVNSSYASFSLDDDDTDLVFVDVYDGYTSVLDRYIFLTDILIGTYDVFVFLTDVDNINFVYNYTALLSSSFNSTSFSSNDVTRSLFVFDDAERFGASWFTSTTDSSCLGLNFKFSGNWSSTSHFSFTLVLARRDVMISDGSYGIFQGASALFVSDNGSSSTIPLEFGYNLVSLSNANSVLPDVVQQDFGGYLILSFSLPWSLQLINFTATGASNAFGYPVSVTFANGVSLSLRWLQNGTYSNGYWSLDTVDKVLPSSAVSQISIRVNSNVGDLLPTYIFSVLSASYVDGFSDGYNSGYDVGLNDGIGQSSGKYDDYYNRGYDDGISLGYDQGYDAGYNSSNTLFAVISSVFDAPITVLRNILDIEILGFNLSSLFFAVLSIVLIVCLIKFFTKGGS